MNARMCAFCGIPATTHEDLLPSVANSAMVFGPLLMAKARGLAGVPRRLADLIADILLRM